MMMTTATDKKIFSPEEQLLRAWDVAKLLGMVGTIFPLFKGI